MSLCGICFGKIEDGKPFDEDNLSYDGCEEPSDFDMLDDSDYEWRDFYNER